MEQIGDYYPNSVAERFKPLSLIYHTIIPNKDIINYSIIKKKQQGSKPCC